MMDDAYMRKAKQELNKLNEIADFDSNMAAKEKAPEDTRSMAEIFAAKRQATTDKLEEQKQEPAKGG